MDDEHDTTNQKPNQTPAGGNDPFAFVDELVTRLGESDVIPPEYDCGHDECRVFLHQFLTEEERLTQLPERAQTACQYAAQGVGPLASEGLRRLVQGNPMLQIAFGAQADLAQAFGSLLRWTFVTGFVRGAEYMGADELAKFDRTREEKDTWERF